MTDNAITLFGGGTKVALTGAKNMAAALKGASQDALGSQLPEGGVYVNFSGKMGRYSIGTEKEDADPNELWLVNVYSFEAGWICWKGGSPVAKRFASIYGAPIDPPNMAEHGPFNDRNGEGWFTGKAFMMRSMDNGRQGYFATNTKSALREFAKIEGEVARRLEEGLPCWPILQLGKEQFTAQGQKNWKPILEVYGWLGMRQVNKLASMDDFDAISEAIDDLIQAAEDDEANGVVDTTMGDPDAAGATDEPDYGDDGIEDAQTVEDGEDEPEDEPEPEPEPAPVPRLPRRAAPVADAAPSAPTRRRKL